MKDYMKRAILGVLALPLLAAAPALADSRAECSNATLRGTYAVTTHGLRIGVYDTASPPAIHYLTWPARSGPI